MISNKDLLLFSVCVCMCEVINLQIYVYYFEFRFRTDFDTKIKLLWRSLRNVKCIYIYKFYRLTNLIVAYRLIYHRRTKDLSICCYPWNQQHMGVYIYNRVKFNLQKIPCSIRFNNGTRFLRSRIIRMIIERSVYRDIYVLNFLV